MKVTVEIDEYDRREGISFEWDAGWEVVTEGTAQGRNRIAGDRDALRGLAAVLLTLAQEEVPAGAHVHLDSFFGLNESAGEILLERL